MLLVGGKIPSFSDKVVFMQMALGPAFLDLCGYALVSRIDAQCSIIVSTCSEFYCTIISIWDKI